jgi:hypothetical protein
MHPTKIGTDGLMGFPGNIAFRHCCEWHFAFDEPASFVPTDDLVQVLSALPAFMHMTRVV